MGLFDKLRKRKDEERGLQKAYDLIYEREYKKARAGQIRKVALEKARRQARQKAKEMEFRPSGIGTKFKSFQRNIPKIQKFAREISNPNLLGEPPRRRKRRRRR